MRFSKRWQPEEVSFLAQQVAFHGPSWEAVAWRMKGRSARACRSQYYEMHLEGAFQDALRVPLPSLATDRRIIHSLPYKPGCSADTFFADFMTQVRAWTPRPDLVDQCTEERRRLDEQPDGIPIVRSRLFPWPDPVAALAKPDRAAYMALQEGLEPVPLSNHPSSFSSHSIPDFIESSAVQSIDTSKEPAESTVLGNLDYAAAWMHYPAEDLSRFLEGGSWYPVEHLQADLPRHRVAFTWKEEVWSELEDAILREAFESFPYAWHRIARCLHRRSPEACRNRLSRMYAPYNLPTSSLSLPPPDALQ
jgi:Myb-like DNA-binding domain